MKNYNIPKLPLSYSFDSKEILLQLLKSSRELAELKGIAKTIPDEKILLNTLIIQEAKDSSEVENIITTQDEIYKAELTFNNSISKTAQKEVLLYREAMIKGFNLLKNKNLMSNAIIKSVQEVLEGNSAGFRTSPGTELQNSKKEIIYIPPQDGDDIERYMANLEQFINNKSLSELDPLLKMAIIHHQFESIHPFYDGNGRTGRIINILYLVYNDLIDFPILYLSRYINHNKTEYYHLLQAIRDNEPDNEKDWVAWIIFMLKGLEIIAKETRYLVCEINKLMEEYKPIIKEELGTKYNRSILNNIFKHPYTKIDYLVEEINVSYHTAAKYLDKLVKKGILVKFKMGKCNYYINDRLYKLLMNNNV